MKANDRAIVDALLRNDFLSFMRLVMSVLNPGARFLLNWHLDALAYHLELVRQGRITRLIINMPPRYLKSKVRIPPGNGFFRPEITWPMCPPISGQRQTETTGTERKAAISATQPSFREISAIAGVNGGRTRTRTLDPLIKSQLLYQLSYAPGLPLATAKGPVV